MIGIFIGAAIIGAVNGYRRYKREAAQRVQADPPPISERERILGLLDKAIHRGKLLTDEEARDVIDRMTITGRINAYEREVMLEGGAFSRPGWRQRIVGVLRKAGN